MSEEMKADAPEEETALDRELHEAIIKLDRETKEKLLKTIELWSK